MQIRSPRSEVPADGGAGDLPPFDLLPVDEGPMRRDLLRQIRQLEEELAQFIVDNCPFEPPIVSSPTRGPGIMSNADLEQIRDEMLETRAALHERIVQRVASMSASRPSRGPAWLRRLRGD
jgi:hypothetical protein